jgi:hypothetical protein
MALKLLRWAAPGCRSAQQLARLPITAGGRRHVADYTSLSLQERGGQPSPEVLMLMREPA